MQQFKDDLDEFKKVWIRFASEYQGVRLKDNQLVEFFNVIEGNLGTNCRNKAEVVRHIVKMNLKCDEQGFVYFNELLFKSMKIIYGHFNIKNRELFKAEYKVVRKLEKIQIRMAKQYR